MPAEPEQDVNVENEALVEMLGPDVTLAISDAWHPLTSVTVRV